MRNATDGPHPLDIALGARIRARRRELRLSQGELGNAVGITFQQVQRYEHGINRIGFSRLVEIAEALDCGFAELAGPLDKSKSPTTLTRQMDYLAEPGARDLLQAYVRIDSSKERAAILNLARQLAHNQRVDQSPAKRSAQKRRRPTRQRR